MGDTCIMCHERLIKCVTVFAGMGHLFCSKRCAVKHLIEVLDVEQIAEIAIDGCIEEVRADDIGIS